MSGKEDEGGGGGKTSEPVNEGKTSPTRDNGSSAGGKTDNFDAVNDQGETLMDRVMAYCRTRDFLKTFEDYILNHLKYFKDAELDEAGEPEHRLEWYDIFQDYLKVFEGVMEEFIEREGGDFNAFYQECRVKQDDGTPHEKVRFRCGQHECQNKRARRWWCAACVVPVFGWWLTLVFLFFFGVVVFFVGAHKIDTTHTTGAAFSQTFISIC